MDMMRLAMQESLETSSNKLLAIGMPDESSKKLLDGVGMTVRDQIERILMESSGERDGEYTIEEDTLKLIECSAKRLKEELNQYRHTSLETFLKRRVFCMHDIGD